MSIEQTSLFELAKSIKQKSLPELAEYITPFTFSDSLCDGGELAFERIEELASAHCTELMQTGYSKKFDDWLGIKIRAYYLKFLAINKKLEHETKFIEIPKINKFTMKLALRKKLILNEINGLLSIVLEIKNQVNDC